MVNQVVGGGERWVGQTIHGLGCLASAQAVAEAHRCLMCHDAPCTAACPARVDVMHFIRALRFENPRRALEVIRRTNVLAGVCGAVCPKERLCEGACLRNALRDPIRIGALQTYAAAHGILHPRRARGNGPPAEDAPPVAVVGAGPAGLAATDVLARCGARVTVFEARQAPGGMLAYGVPEERMPYAFVRAEVSPVLARPGIEFRPGQALGRDFSLDDLFARGFRGVFVGVGLWKAARLPGVSDVAGVLHALPFLEAAARHARFGGPAPVVGARCLVIGGGSVALDCAEVARRCGARDIEVMCLENTDEMPATREDIEAGWRAGVRFWTRRRVTGVEASPVSSFSVETIGIRWKEPGRFVPDNAEDLPGTEARHRVDTLIVAIGQAQDPGVAQALAGLDRDARGLVLVDPETLVTSVAGVFAGGDCAAGCGRTVVASVAEGRRAGLAIAAFLGLRPPAGPYVPPIFRTAAGGGWAGHEETAR